MDARTDPYPPDPDPLAPSGDGASPLRRSSAGRRVMARAVDAALEGTVALSFSRLGYEWRDRLFEWTDLRERPMRDKVAIVTGATSGLGLAAATRLASLGASVRLLGRDAGRTEHARQQIAAETGNDDIEIGVADLARLDDVRRFADADPRHPRAPRRADPQRRRPRARAPSSPPTGWS